MKILEANNITKYFPGVKALSNVDFDINRGEIHCIIGENGAGKSTLIKCLTGVYHPEEGRILIDGKDTKKQSELFNKVAYVPQELDLFNDLTVAENLFLPFDKTGIKGFINPRQLEKKALPLLEKFKINVQPDMLIRDIPVSAQQLVQIVRATVHQNYEVLMLDEPTTSLTTEDTATLFEAIRDIKAAGKAVIFISHKLEEILALGEVVTVFRNGQKVAFANVKDIDIPWIIRKMTGHALNHEKTFFSGKVSEKVLLEVENLTGDKFYDISFRLHEGEILGFAGLVGAGRSEIMQAIFGYTPVYSGEVLVHGQKWKLGDTSYSVHNGLVYLPEERKKQGIFPILSVKENISMPLLDKLKAVFTISKKKKSSLASISMVLILMIIFASFASPYFLDIYNIQSLIRDLAFIGMIGIAQSLLLLVGELDLSVGTVASLCGILAGIMMMNMGIPSYLSLIIALLFGLVFGTINGLLITKLKLNAMVATIGMQGVYGGINLVLTKGKAITGIPSEIYILGKGNIGPIPIPFLFTLAVLIGVIFLVKKTKTGRYIYAIGNNTFMQSATTGKPPQFWV